MTTRGVRIAAAIAATALALTACSGQATPQPTPSSASAASSSGAVWPPSNMTGFGPNLAWRWTEKGTFRCESYQDGCFGVTVMTLNGCPDGVYIEVGVIDASGAVVDKANEITAGLAPVGIARATLSPPGGVGAGAQARLTKLSCL